MAASNRRDEARSASSLALAVCLTARGSIRTSELSIARLSDNVPVPSTAIARSRAQFLAATLVAVLLALAWTLPISRREIVDGDFPSHLKTAEQVAASPHVPAPHFLFFGSVASLLVIFPQLTSTTAGLIVISVIHILTALVILWYLRREAGTVSLSTILVATALLIVAPILPPPVQPSVYLIGYFTPNPYHNATFITSKPFCLLLLFAVAAAFRPNAGRGVVGWLLAAVLLAAISKPNYIVCVVPAACLFALWRYRRHEPVRWSAIVTLTLMAVIVIVIAARAYGTEENDGAHIVVAPFAVLRFYTDIGPSVVAKLLASVAFPLVVAAVWPALLRRPDVWLAWAATIVGIGQGYLLAEAGSRMDHANLLVGASQAVFVLMVVSAGAFMSLPRAVTITERLRRWCAVAVLLLHVASGYRHASLKLLPGAWIDEPLSAVTLVALIAWIVVMSRSETRRAGEVMAG